MSKCEYINLLNETTFNTDEMFDALELLDENCAECNNPVCNPEEIQDIESLCDVIEGLTEDEDEEGLNLCEDCAREYELNKEAYLSGEKILELCPECYESYKEYDDECEDEKTDVELELEKLALEEEIKRIEKQDMVLDIPEVAKQSDAFKTAMAEAFAVAGAFKVLMKAGIDFNNSVSIASNIITNYQNKEIAKVQQVVGLQNQI